MRSTLEIQPEKTYRLHNQVCQNPKCLKPMDTLPKTNAGRKYCSLACSRAVFKTNGHTRVVLNTQKKEANARAAESAVSWFAKFSAETHANQMKKVQIP